MRDKRAGGQLQATHSFRAISLALDETAGGHEPKHWGKGERFLTPSRRTPTLPLPRLVAKR